VNVTPTVKTALDCAMLIKVLLFYKFQPFHPVNDFYFFLPCLLHVDTIARWSKVHCKPETCSKN